MNDQTTSNALPQDLKTILINTEHQVLFITLNRPQVRNAMSLEMVSELRHLFTAIEEQDEIRAVVIRGAEGHFCSGGDIKDMVNARANAASVSPDPATNFVNDPYYQLNRAYGLLLKEVNSCSKVVIAVAEGSVMGGGIGITAAADLVLAHYSTKLSMPETRIGVIPAQIIPFISAKIGERQIRKLALLGLTIKGEALIEYGLADHMWKDEAELTQLLDWHVEKARVCAPHAVAITKELISQVSDLPLDQLLDLGAQAFAKAIRSDEGVEGTMAFVQKRRPSWAPSENEVKAVPHQATTRQHSDNEVTHD